MEVTVEQKLRLEALRLAVQLKTSDPALKDVKTLDLAATMYKYINEGK